MVYGTVLYQLDMMSIIALVIWEGMVIYVAKLFVDAITTQEGSASEKVGVSLMAIVLVAGLAFLPFTSVF